MQTRKCDSCHGYSTGQTDSKAHNCAQCGGLGLVCASCGSARCIQRGECFATAAQKTATEILRQVRAKHDQDRARRKALLAERIWALDITAAMLMPGGTIRRTLEELRNELREELRRLSGRSGPTTG